jgi:hypothetical protein
LCAFFGGLACGLSALLVALNLDASSWHVARSMPLGWLAAVLSAAALCAVGARRLALPLDRREQPVAFERATVGLGATERAVWSSTATNPWLAGLGTVLGGAGLLATAATPIAAPAALIIAGLALVMFCRVRVRIDSQGMTVAYGPFEFPRTRIPLARIRAARALELSPLEHGGWGYRGSLWLFGKAAIVIRRGPAIELQRRDGKVLFVTVDDALTGAGLLNDLAARGAA